MKTSFLRWFANVWLVLSEVPGWPDAPLGMRLRRAAPVLIAVAGMLALVAWKFGWREPAIAGLRALHSPVVALDAEVELLAMECSDVQAVEAAEQARLAATLLLDSEEDATAQLRQLHEQIRALGWDVAFQAYDSAIAGTESAEGLQFVSARGRLTPLPGNATPFRALLGVFDQISGADKRIDLIRLGVRADEPGKLEVEISLRLACRSADEKTS